MKVARSTMVTAGVAAAAALAATGITYASAASAPVPEAAPVSAVAAPAPRGGDSGQSKGNGNNNGNNNGNENGNENWGKGNEGKGNEGREEGEEGERRHHEGRIEVNERSYSAHPGDCITVVSGLGAKSLNIRNETRKTVEVFRGAVCDNGAPIATVGPHSESNGVHPCRTEGIEVDDGVVASFRVIKHHHHDEDDD